MTSRRSRFLTIIGLFAFLLIINGKAWGADITGAINSIRSGTLTQAQINQLLTSSGYTNTEIGQILNQSGISTAQISTTLHDLSTGGFSVSSLSTILTGGGFNPTSISGIIGGLGGSGIDLSTIGGIVGGLNTNGISVASIGSILASSGLANTSIGTILGNTGLSNTALGGIIGGLSTNGVTVASIGGILANSGLANTAIGSVLGGSGLSAGSISGIIGGLSTNGFNMTSISNIVGSLGLSGLSNTTLGNIIGSLSTNGFTVANITSILAGSNLANSAIGSILGNSGLTSGNISTIIGGLSTGGFSIASIGNIVNGLGLSGLSNTALGSIIGGLSTNGISVASIGNILSGSGLANNVIGGLLGNTGLTATNISSILGTLSTNGFSISSIGGVLGGLGLSGLGNGTLGSIIGALGSNGFSVANIGNILSGSGLAGSAIGSILSGSGLSVANISSILTGSGFSAANIGSILGGLSVGGYSIADLGTLVNGLSIAGFSATDIGNMLAGSGISAADLSSILTASGLPPGVVNQINNAINAVTGGTGGGGSGGGGGGCGFCDPMLNMVEDVTLQSFMTAAITTTTARIINHTNDAFEKHKDWLVNDYFKQYVLPAMMLMAEQLSSVAMQQMAILGTFMDAKHQLETERLYQQLAAQAHKDYHPSENMCTIGTVARSLAGADRNAEMNALMMSQRSMDRQLMNRNGIAATGRDSDRNSRTRHFRETYCDKKDNNDGLGGVCANGVTTARMNKDVDFARTLWNPLSLDVDFSNGTTTADEEDILALQANLYAHHIFKQPLTDGLLRYDAAHPELREGNRQAYADMRAVIAKRSVAENSFEAIAAMKSAGTSTNANTATYLQAVMKELNPNMTDADALRMIGANPSYYAQMEILTKKLLQNPQFFTDLYDKPANVARKGVALQAISLMQDRDYFKSNMRSEAILSVLLELEVNDAQKKVQNEIDRLVK